MNQLSENNGTTVLSVLADSSFARLFVQIVTFLLLVALLITRNAQDMSERMFWLNETYEFVIASRSFWEIPVLTIKFWIMQPPLFYWLGHVVAKIGTDPLTLRSLSLLLSIGMIGFVLFGIRELKFVSRVFLSFVLIMSPFGAFAATAFRPYALAALSILVSSVFFFRAVQQPSKWSSAILYGISALALQYSLTLNCLTFGLQMSCLGIIIVRGVQREGLNQTLVKYKPLIIVCIPLNIAYALVLIMLMQTGLRFFQQPPFDFNAYVRALLKNAVQLKEKIVLLRSWALSFGPACFLLGAIYGLRRNLSVTAYLLVLFGGQLLFSTFMTYSRLDYFGFRYLVASYVAFALLSAIGADYIFQRLDRRTSLLIVAFLLVTTLPGGIIQYASSLNTPAFNPIKQAIEDLRCDNDPTVVLSDPWRNNYVPWFAYRDDPFILVPTQKNLYKSDPTDIISRGAAEKYCFILIEGPQDNIYKGKTYDILFALPGYTVEKRSITPGRAIPDFAWLFTPVSFDKGRN